MDVGQRRRRFDPQHKISEADMRDLLDAVVETVNRTPGPRLAKVEGKGYGLFAEKSYKAGEVVTVYGGKWVAPGVTGPYVIEFAPNRIINGAYGFYPDEKGRWINDPQTRRSQTPDELMALENVNVLRNGRTVYMIATRPIDEGEELLWYYGEDYDRDWLPPEEETESERESETGPVHETMLETLRREGVDEKEIARMEAWLAPHGYDLATFNVEVASEDPERFGVLPKDVRHLLMRHVIDEVLLETKEDPCVGVAYVMRLGRRIVSMADLLNTDDGLWRRFFLHDFERFGEHAPWWTGHHPMPWRSAYLWTVFFRRRCLRELARLRASALGGAYEQTFGPIAFGMPGCVSALAVYHREWEAPMENRRLVGYVGARDLRGGGQFVYPTRTAWGQARILQGIHERKNEYENPGQELSLALRYLSTEHPTMESLRGAWSQKLRPHGTETLAAAVAWDYGGSLFAYCEIQGLRDQSALFLPFVQSIVASLPDIPHLGKRLYLGMTVATARDE